MEYLLVDKDQWIIMDPSTTLIGTSTKYWENLDGKAKSTIWLSLRLSITKCVRGSYNQGFMKQVKIFVSVYILVKQIVPMEEFLQPMNESWRLGDRAFECLQYNKKSVIID
jgi:hypothetical protein